MEILVEHGKHGKAYYTIPTPEAKAKVALHILTRRVKDRYIFEPSLYLPNGITVEDNLSDEQIAGLPTETLRDAATERRRKYRVAMDEYTRSKEEWDEINRIVTEGDDSSTVTELPNGRQRVQSPAWGALLQRSDWEYERVEVETAMEVA